jgi:phage shock protein C
VARYFGVDVTLVRIVWLIVALLPPGAGLIAYAVCWIVMPIEPLALLGPATEAPSGSAA